MSLFDDIVKTVEKSETPGLESLTATEIGGISVNGNFDVDEDPMLGMAMEAMGKDVQYDADADPEAAGYSDKDIEKLSEAGAAEEDEDDDYSEETIGELLDGFVEAVYGDPEDEDPTDLLSEEDLDDIDDDLEEGMEGLKEVKRNISANHSLKKSYAAVQKAYNSFLKPNKSAMETAIAILATPLATMAVNTARTMRHVADLKNNDRSLGLGSRSEIVIDNFFEAYQRTTIFDIQTGSVKAVGEYTLTPELWVILLGISAAGAIGVGSKVLSKISNETLKKYSGRYRSSHNKIKKLYDSVTSVYNKIKDEDLDGKEAELKVFDQFCKKMAEVILHELEIITKDLNSLNKEAKSNKKTGMSEDDVDKRYKNESEVKAAFKKTGDEQEESGKTFKKTAKESLETIALDMLDIADNLYECFSDVYDAFEAYYDSEDDFNVAIEGADTPSLAESETPATESVENKKDLKSVKKRIKALEDELETNKKTCDSINANMKKLQKKSKRDVEALKDLVAFTASLGAQMVRQTAINAEIAQLKKEVSDYKNGVAQEKEARREAKGAEQDVANIAKDYAGVTADYSDMVDEVKDLSEDVIEEVKEEEKAANNGKLGDRVKKFLGDFSNAWAEASANQGSMVSAMASYCLGDDIDMIAEESYIDIVKVYAQRDEEFESSIDAINITIEAFESYLGDNADDMDDIYPVYSSLLDMRAAFEAVAENEKDIQKEIEILEKWVKFYGSQAMKNPSSFLEREIKNLKNRIASLKAKLEVPAAASATV